MFLLQKWYFDCVTEAGDVAILYRASVRYGPIRLAYGASLCKPAEGQPRQRTTLRPQTDAETSRHGVSWQCPRLMVDGTWSRLSPGFETSLLSGPSGHIHWQCVCPRAAVDLQLGGHRLQGSGYVERLTMTIKPWQLPFDELRWGRMIGRDESLIWIDWRGGEARTWVWHNDEPSRCRVHDQRVEVPEKNLVLALRNETLLRGGALNETALRPIRLLTSWLPRWHAAHETKWLARAALNGPGCSDTGWSIHEVVRW